MTTNKKITNEGISGVYPQLSLWQEFGSAVVTGIMFILPIVFAKLKHSLSQSDLIKYTSRVLDAVKKDPSKEPLKNKIARAIQSTMANPNVDASAHVNYQQDVLNLLPNDLEHKDEEQVKKYINTSRERLGLPPVRQTRG